MSSGTHTHGWSISPKLLENVRHLRRAQRQGGCSIGCETDRTDDSRLPWSSDGAYGGWGGHAFHRTEPGSERTPVVFVHGNQRDACDWLDHATFFLQRGYLGDDCWAITFGDGTPTHPEMAEQLDTFVGHVREYTGSDTVSVVSHSLGVTGVRYWLAAHDRFEWVDAFVGLAGANHGTVLNRWCDEAGRSTGAYKVCPFLRADYERFDGHPLSVLNRDETPGEIDYYTIRGTDDPLFWRCEDSPELAGATNAVLETDHDGVRTEIRAMELVFEWVSGDNPYDLQNHVALPG